MKNLKQLTILVCIVLAHLLVITTAVNASVSVDIVRVRVLLPDNSFAQGVYAELYDSDGYYVDSGQANALGWLNFIDLYEGLYTLKLHPSQSNSLANAGLYKDVESTFTVDSTEAVYEGALNSFVQTLNPITLEEATRYIKVQVTRAVTGGPIVGLDVSGWSQDPNVTTYYNLRTGSDGIVHMALAENDTSTWSISTWDPNGIYPECFQEVKPNAGAGETLVTCTLAAADSNLVLNLVDGNGSAFSVPSTVNWADASCHSKDGYYFKWASLSSGDTSVTVKVKAGEYNCQVNLEGYGTSKAHLTVASGATATADITIYTKDASIILRIVDSVSGAVISDLYADFSVWTRSPKEGESGTDDYAYEYNNLGQATLSVINGLIYEASVWIDQSQSQTATGMIAAGGTNYILPNQVVEFTASSSETKYVDFQLTPATATIQVNAFDANGAPLSAGWADAFSESSHEEGENHEKDLNASHVQTIAMSDGIKDIFLGAQIVNGVATIPAIPGSYNVRIFPEYMDGDDALPSAPVEITVADGETVTVNAQLRTVNHHVAIAVSIDQNTTTIATESHDFLGCWGYTHNDDHNFTEGDIASMTANLPLFVDTDLTSWTIGCDLVSGSGEDYKFYSAQTTYTPESGASTGSLSLSLVEGGDFFPPKSFTFQADKSISFGFQDGETTLDAPAGAFASSGTVVITTETGKGYIVDNNGTPTLTFDISATVDGVKKEKLERAVTLSFKIDLVELSDEYDMEITAEDLIASSYDETTNNWKQDASYSYDDETKTLSVSVTHFSIWGTLIQKSKALKKLILSNLKVKKQKTKKKKKKKKKKGKKKQDFLVSFDAPEGADASQPYIVAYLFALTKKALKKKDFDKKAKQKEIVGNSTSLKFKKGRIYQVCAWLKDSDNSVCKYKKVR